MDEAGVTELVAWSSTPGAWVVAGALLMERLADEPGLVAAVDPARRRARARGACGDRGRARARLAGGLWPPSPNAHHLERLRKEQVVMAAGGLTPLDKRRVALAVAMNAALGYMIGTRARCCALPATTTSAVLEILGVVDHYNALNTLRTAMTDRLLTSGLRLTVVRSAPAPIRRRRRWPGRPPVTASRGAGEPTPRPSVFTAPKPRGAACVRNGKGDAGHRVAPTVGGPHARELYGLGGGERRLRAALAAGREERAQRAKIKKGLLRVRGPARDPLHPAMLFL